MVTTFDFVNFQGGGRNVEFQNVKMVFLVDQNVEIQKDQNVENGF
jgi:hypothetical protein